MVAIHWNVSMMFRDTFRTSMAPIHLNCLCALHQLNFWQIHFNNLFNIMMITIIEEYIIWYCIFYKTLALGSWTSALGPTYKYFHLCKFILFLQLLRTDVPNRLVTIKNIRHLRSQEISHTKNVKCTIPCILCQWNSLWDEKSIFIKYPDIILYSGKPYIFYSNNVQCNGHLHQPLNIWWISKGWIRFSEQIANEDGHHSPNTHIFANEWTFLCDLLEYFLSV